MHQVVVMCPHVVPCVSSYHLAPTKWTQNHSEALKRDQIRARTRQNHEESQGETGKKPQKHLRSCQNHSETIKKPWKASKTLQKHSKTLQKQAKGSQNQAKDTETPLAFRGKHHKSLIKESKLSHKGPEAPETLKMTQNLSKSPKTTQKPSKTIKIYQSQGPDPALR